MTPQWPALHAPLDNLNRKGGTMTPTIERAHPRATYWSLRTTTGMTIAKLSYREARRLLRVVREWPEWERPDSDLQKDRAFQRRVLDAIAATCPTAPVRYALLRQHLAVNP